MISKRSRGISRRETDTLFCEGEKIRFRNGTFYWLTRDTGMGSRVAVSIARKAAKNAVSRGLFRRRIQAAIRPLLDVCKAADIMIVWATPRTPDVTVHREEIRHVLTKAGLFE